MKLSLFEGESFGFRVVVIVAVDEPPTDDGPFGEQALRRRRVRPFQLATELGHRPRRCLPDGETVTGRVIEQLIFEPSRRGAIGVDQFDLFGIVEEFPKLGEASPVPLVRPPQKIINGFGDWGAVAPSIDLGSTSISSPPPFASMMLMESCCDHDRVGYGLHPRKPIRDGAVLDRGLPKFVPHLLRSARSSSREADEVGCLATSDIPRLDSATPPTGVVVVELAVDRFPSPSLYPTKLRMPRSGIVHVHSLGLPESRHQLVDAARQLPALVNGLDLIRPRRSDRLWGGRPDGIEDRHRGAGGGSRKGTTVGSEAPG